MGLGRDILERDLDVAGLQLYNLRTAVNPSDAVRFDQLPTFSSGLTKTGNNVTNDVITGKAGGQVWTSGTAAGDTLTIRTTSAGSPSGLMTLQAGGILASAATISLQGTTTIQSLTGMLKATAGVVGVGAAGTDYESPLIFSTGLTRAVNTITSDLSTGKGAAQTAYGGFTSGGSLTLSSTFNATKGLINFGTSTYDEANNRLDVQSASSSQNVPTLTVSSSDASGQAVVQFRTSANGVRGGIRADFLGNLTWFSKGGPHYFLTGGDFGTGNVRAKIFANGNFLVSPQPVNNDASDLGALVGASGTASGAQITRWAASPANIASAAGATLSAHSWDNVLVSISGTTAITNASGFNFAVFTQPSFLGLTGPLTVTNAATVQIAGSPVAGTNITITNGYALWVLSGTTYLQGTTRLASLNGMLKGTTGVVSVAAAGTDYQAPLSAADATISFPTATTVKVGTLPNKFVVQGTTDPTLSAAQFLGALGTGIVKNTTTTGVLSIAAAGTDYQAPLTAANSTILFPSPTTIQVNQLSNKFIVQGTADAMLTGAQFTGALATGLVKNTTTTGVFSIAAAGTDYQSPLTFGAGLNLTGSNVTALVATGLAGGQAIYGGTAPTENLRLQSTINAGTKGLIQFGTSSYDENAQVLTVLSAITASSSPTLIVASSSASGQMGISFRSNTSSQKGLIRADNAGNLNWVAQGGDHYFFTAGDFGVGNIRAKIFNNGNFLVQPAAVSSNPSDIGSLLGVSGNSPQPVITRFNATPSAQTGVAGSTWNCHLWDNVTEQLNAGVNVTTATGFNFMTINAPTINTTLTVANAATVYVQNQVLVTGGGAITNSYALWVDGGTTRLDGTVIVGTLTGILKGTSGTVSVAASGTDYELPLTFSTGLTRASNTITANLSTGVAGGQTAFGGNATGLNLTLKSNTVSDGKILFSSTNNGFNENTGTMFLGTSSPISTALYHLNKDTNALAEVFVTNPNAGGSAGASVMLGLNAASDTSQRLQMTLTGTNFSPIGLLTAQAAFLSHQPNNGAPFIFSQQGTGDMIWTTTSSITERMRLQSGGILQLQGAAGTNQASTPSQHRLVFKAPIYSDATAVPLTGESGGAYIPIAIDGVLSSSILFGSAPTSVIGYIPIYFRPDNQ